MHTFGQHTKISFWRGDDYIIPSMHCLRAPAILSAFLLLLIHYNLYSSSWKLPTRYILQQRLFFFLALRMKIYHLLLNKTTKIICNCLSFIFSSPVITWSPFFCPQKSDSQVEQSSSNTCTSAAASAKWRTAFTIWENVANDHQSHRTAVGTNTSAVCESAASNTGFLKI